MYQRFASATAAVLYRFSLLVGLALLPVAVLARRAGITVPVHQILDRLETSAADD